MTRPSPMIRTGYWCECWTQSPATGPAPALLAAIDVETAAQAIRWIKIALRTIASALERDAFHDAWDWVSAGHLESLQALTAAEPCTYTVHHGTTTIEWTARPVLFLALAHRTHNRPTCADAFRTGPWTSGPAVDDPD